MASSAAKKRKAVSDVLSRGGGSGDRNTAGFIKGSILRIKMENFVIYDCCEVYPGPHLNMIMGPNGTGKSTIVCAMCLGLGGPTSLLGRAKELGEFVKRGTNKAVIELDLFNPEGRNYKLRREIIRQGNKSHFYLNNLPKTNKEVKQFVLDMNIQIGNLCQFLPQDKVVEFAQMNPIELLENTEKAIGPVGLFDDHMKLKNCRNQEKELELQLKDKTEHLDKLKQQNSRVERDVQRFQERQKTLEKIETLEKKKVWMQYDQKRVAFEKCRKEKEKVKEAFEQKQRQAAPLEAKLTKASEELKKLEQRMKELTTDITRTENAAKKKRDEMSDLNEQISAVQDELREKKNQEQERLRKIHEWQQQVEGWKRELEQLAPAENLKPQLEANLAEINRLTQAANNIDTDCRNIKRERDDAKRELKMMEARLKQLNDMRDQRLRALRSKFPDTFNAVKWLRENRDKFKKPIHEPIALVVNIEDKQNAKYVERAIPGQDMLAFVCEDSDDQDKFIAEVREKQKLRVNVIKSPQEPLSYFKPQVPIQQLGYGFKSYLVDLFTAPDAVMAYLCKMHKVHLIPLGSDATERNVGRVIENSGLRSFYTPGYHYAIKQSRYGNQNKSSRSSQVPEARLLAASSVDINEKRDLELQIQEREKSVQTGQERFARLEREHTELTTKIEGLKEERQKLNKSRNQRKTIQQNISAKLDSIRRKEGSAVNLEEEKQKAVRKIATINNRKLKVIQKVHQLIEACLDKSMEKVTMSLHHEMCNRQKVLCESNIRETASEKQSLETRLREIQTETDRTKAEAKTLLKEARTKTGSDKPSDHLRKLFDEYPNDIEDLEDMIHREQAQAECQYPTDESVVRDYEKRKRDIRQVDSEVDQKRQELEQHRDMINKLKRTWLAELTVLVKQINEKFSLFFNAMGCAGEVDLHYPNEEDYDKYGIRIRVKFRSNEQLQLLTSTYQSGGERSVSTILYLMALQELNKCPFRVVDEINQGMDPGNERKVFEFVVETACRENTSQYFLITPKLLPNLKYGPKMKVLCVYNSHWMVSHKEWNIDRFIKGKERLNRRIGGYAD